MNRWLLLIALSLAVCASVPVQAQDEDTSFHIAVIGDRTGGHRPEVFENAIGNIQAMQPDLVLSVGDLIEGYIEDETELTRQWVEVEAQINRFGESFHTVPGNHDYSNAIQARMWNERRGAPYWSVLHQGVLILGLSTEDPPITLPERAMEGHVRLQRAMERDPEGTQQQILERAGQIDPVNKPGDVAISDEQVDYFRQVLADNPEPRWTILLMHKPAWNYDNANFARIESLLRDRRYTVIAGHEHYYAHEERAGHDYLTMGTTGGIWLQDGPGRVDHILWIAIGEGEPSFTNIEIGGMFEKTGR